VLLPILQVARDKLARMLGKVCGKKLVPRISMDNPRIHKAAVKDYKQQLVALGWDDSITMFPLPTYSPDFHRVIEHTHGRAVLAFQKWLYTNPRKHSLKKYMQEFERMYRECCTPDIIAADVAGMPDLYKHVAAHEGAWAPASMR
jgi:hypothetical protein